MLLLLLPCFVELGDRDIEHGCCALWCLVARSVLIERPRVTVGVLMLLLVLLIERWRFVAVFVVDDALDFVSVAEVGGRFVTVVVAELRVVLTSCSYQWHINQLMWPNLEVILGSLFLWILNPCLCEAARELLSWRLALLTADWAVLCAMDVFVRVVDSLIHAVVAVVETLNCTCLSMRWLYLRNGVPIGIDRNQKIVTLLLKPLL